MGLPYIALAVSIVALLVTFINASIGIINFILIRFRIVSVDVGAVFSGGESFLWVDVTSLGATVHDLEVEIRIFVPRRFERTLLGRERLCLGNQLWGLEELRRPDPLAAGQSAIFEIELSPFEEEGYADTMRKIVPQLERKNVMLEVFCDGRRKKLRCISSEHFLFQFETFLGCKKRRFSKWLALQYKVLHLWRGGGYKPDTYREHKRSKERRERELKQQRKEGGIFL